MMRRDVAHYEAPCPACRRVLVKESERIGSPLVMAFFHCGENFGVGRSIYHPDGTVVHNPQSLPGSSERRKASEDRTLTAFSQIMRSYWEHYSRMDGIRAERALVELITNDMARALGLEGWERDAFLHEILGPVEK